MKSINDIRLKKLQKFLKDYASERLDIYSDECFIKDVIYFLGLSFDEKKYLYRPGMCEFINDKLTKALEEYKLVNDSKIKGD